MATLSVGARLTQALEPSRRKLLLVAAALAILDWGAERAGGSTFPGGPLDESAHLLTVLLVSFALGPSPRARAVRARLLLPALVAAVAIDLDHVPALAGSQWLTAGTPRPYTHSLVLVAALLVAAGLVRAARPRFRRGPDLLLGRARNRLFRRGPDLLLGRARNRVFRRGPDLLLGFAAGVTIHLFRDLGEPGSGVALVWPISYRSLSFPHLAYLLTMLGLLLAGLWRTRPVERQYEDCSSDIIVEALPPPTGEPLESANPISR